MNKVTASAFCSSNYKRAKIFGKGVGKEGVLIYGIKLFLGSLSMPDKIC